MPSMLPRSLKPFTTATYLRKHACVVLSALATGTIAVMREPEPSAPQSPSHDTDARKVLAPQVFSSPGQQSMLGPANGIPHPDWASVDDAIQEICNKTGTPGLSYGIAQGNKRFTKHFGLADQEHKIPPSDKHRYGVGSCTKSLTASAIAILVQEGKLQWDTPVKEILPELHTTNDNTTNAMTVVDLLSHRTGLAGSNHWWYGADTELLISKQELMKYFNALDSVAPIGKKFAYSNWGFAVAGLVIEKLSGLSVGEYIRSAVLEPLEMLDSTLDPAAVPASELAKTYAALDDGSVVPLPQPKAKDGTCMAAAMGLRATVPDMLKYGQGLIAALHAEQSKGSSDHPLKNVGYQLSPLTPKNTGSDEVDSYGLGFHIHKLPSQFKGLGCNPMYCPDMPAVSAGTGNPMVMAHGGSLAGYTTTFAIVPEFDTTIVACTNSIGLADPSQWILQVLLSSLVADPHLQPEDYVTTAINAAKAHVRSSSTMNEKYLKEKDNSTRRPASTYAGTYQDKKRGFAIVIEGTDDEQLDVLFQGMESQRWSLKPWKGDTLSWLQDRNTQARRARFTYSPENTFKIIFGEPDEKGAVTKLYWPHDPAVSVEEQVFYRSSTAEEKL